jgi:NAD(P)-dependent dehydrogenase (short-subunit alcohol dehydrogenase family)
MADTLRPAALVSNATGFGGPPAVAALLEAGFRVLAHDPGFADDACWQAFAAGRSGLHPLCDTAPEAVIASALQQTDRLPVIVSNDHYPAPTRQPEEADPAELTRNYEKLVEFPFRLIQAALPHLKTLGSANIVMVTSNRTRLPLSGGAFPDAARAAVNALVKSLAIDLAPHGITLNAVAPNFLYSEAYYPKAFFIETEAGRDYVRRSVPVGRLAAPEEIGEVIRFLATARTRFLTGAILDFSGGWPFGAPRPAG